MLDSFVTPWIVARQAPLSMGLLRQEYWSGLPFPSPEDLPDPGTEPTFSALQVDSLLLSPWGSTHWTAPGKTQWLSRESTGKRIQGQRQWQSMAHSEHDALRSLEAPAVSKDYLPFVDACCAVQNVYNHSCCSTAWLWMVTGKHPTTLFC